MSRIGAIVLGLLSLAPMRALPQAKPDFSGTWIIDAARNRTPAGAIPARPAFGEQFTATQDAAALTVRRTVVGNRMLPNGPERQPMRPEASYSVVYPFDGSDVRYTVPSAIEGEPASERMGSARWNGAALVIKSWPVGNASSPQQYTLRMDPAGGLAIAFTASVPGGAASTSTTIYKKAK